MDEIRESFQRVRQDIDILRQEIQDLRRYLTELTDFIAQNLSTQTPKNQTNSFDTSTHDTPFNALKPQNMHISTGNQGVPTDRQTDRQTNRQTPISDGTPDFDQAAEILDSLDNIKKQIRLKFKRLTEQEILVFSTIYQIEEEQGPTDYRAVAARLGLTESSIRDYVGRLKKKGIPVEKKRVNNKYIQLSISKNLKKIASLSTILQLRGI